MNEGASASETVYCEVSFLPRLNLNHDDRLHSSLIITVMSERASASETVYYEVSFLPLKSLSHDDRLHSTQVSQSLFIRFLYTTH